MSFNQQHLNSLMTAIKNLSESDRDKLLLDASMTDYDFEVLVDYSDNIEEDIKSETLMDLDFEEYLTDSEKFGDMRDSAQISLLTCMLKQLEESKDSKKLASLVQSTMSDVFLEMDLDELLEVKFI